MHTISGGDFATDESLKNLGIFAYPDLKNLKKTTVQNAQTFQFIMTDSAGKKRFGTCARCLAFGVAPRFPVSVVLMTDCAPEPSFLEQLLSLVTQKVMFGSLLSCVPILHAAYQAEMAPRKFPTQETQDVCVRVSASEEYRFIRPPERDCLLEQMGVVPVLHKLSATNLVTLFAHLLHERRVVFQSASLESLSRGIQSITALLYPFSWQWVYVPVLPETLISFACAPMPFVIGILSSFPLLDLKDLMDEVYIFDLDRDQFVMRGSHNDLESLPAGYRNAIIKQLEISKQEDRAGSAWQGKLLARPFLAFFVQLFWNYKRFFTSGPMREFDRAGFLESKSSTVSRAFLQEFLGTQMATTFFHEYERGNTVHFATFERLTGFVLDEFNNAVAELERANPRIKFRRRMSRMLPFLNKPGSMASLPALGASHNNLSAINTANAASGTGTAVGATAAAAGATSPSAARKGLTSPGLNRRKMQASSATAADENNAFDVQIVKKEEQSVFPGIKLSTMSRRPKQTVSKPSVNDVFTTPVKVAAAPVSDAFASPQSPFHIVGPVDPSQSPCLFSPQSMVVVAPTSIATGPSVTFRDEDEQMASPPPFHPASPTDSNRIQVRRTHKGLDLFQTNSFFLFSILSDIFLSISKLLFHMSWKDSADALLRRTVMQLQFCFLTRLVAVTNTTKTTTN